MSEAMRPARRDLLCSAGAAAWVAAAPTWARPDPAPEVRRIRLARFGGAGIACLGPMWIAEELLRAEGFDEVQYVPIVTQALPDEFAALATGAIDLVQTDIFESLLALDTGRPLAVLAGIHAGCYEVYGRSGLRSLRDLKNRTICAGGGGRAFISIMLAHVGLDPRRDVTFVEEEPVRALADGRVDAVLAFPPEPQILRERGIGVRLIDTAVDRPWSQYLCCMAVGSREFVAKHPVATRRALRALVKAADLCSAEPERVARTLAERGFYTEYKVAAQTLKDIPFRRWRDYDPADSMRFYALRFHEAGLVRSIPQKLLAQGTDWRFIEQLKRELKS